MSRRTVSAKFPPYTQFDPRVPVWCVTPNTDRTIHRYFDSSPFSPTGRYLLSTQLPQENRLPRPGEKARLILTDLVDGGETCVAETYGWDTQVGAHAQWGASDDTVLYNDVDLENWTPHGVRLNWKSGSKARFEGPIYAVSHDATFAVCPNLMRTGLVQAGYGVLVPPENVPQFWDASDDDGIYEVDLTTGTQRQVISVRQLVEQISTPLANRTCRHRQLVVFHMSLSPDDQKILFILRWMEMPTGVSKAIHSYRQQVARVMAKAGLVLRQEWLRQAARMPKQVFNTLLMVNRDGTNVRTVLPADIYARGGHHPNWCPDGHSLLMNLKVDGIMRFVRLGADEQGYEVLSDAVMGSGHPTMHPNGRHILTDTYVSESLAFGDGTVPLRLVDWQHDTEETLVRIGALPPFSGPKGELRVDLHPAWEKGWQRVAFNACPDGTRRVYLADMSQLGL